MCLHPECSVELDLKESGLELGTTPCGVVLAFDTSGYTSMELDKGLIDWGWTRARELAFP